MTTGWFNLATNFQLTSNLYYLSFIFSVAIFLSGALSLTAITLNRVIGIAMPTLADTLELNPLITYAILISIWLISFGTAVPNFFYREYKVRHH